MATPNLIGIQVTLRELLLIVALVAIGLASLKVGGFLSACFVVGCMLFFMAMAITALVDRGLRRTFAIGLVVCVLAYGVILVAASAFRPPVELPTTQWLNIGYEAIVERTWVDTFSGRELPNFDPDQHSLTGVSIESERPERGDFLLVGHILWALALGYGGGKFAQYTSARRQRELEASALPNDDVMAEHT